LTNKLLGYCPKLLREKARRKRQKKSKRKSIPFKKF